MSRIRINSELENSATPGSIIITDNNNEPTYVSPGSNGQILTVVSGIPQYITPSSGSGTLTGANNGLNVVSYVSPGSNVAKLGGTLLQDTTITGTSTSTSTGFELTLDTLKKFTANFYNINFNLDAFKFLHTTSTANAGHLAYNNLFLGKGAGQTFNISGLGVANTAIGPEALYSLIGTLNAEASSNTAIGYKAMKPAQYAVTNTAIGTVAMGDMGTGSSGSPIQANVAIGHHALRQIGGSFNVAMGQSASENNLAANYTVAIGQMALQANTVADNVAIGAFAGWKNTTALKNVFIGKSAGQEGLTSEKNFYGGWQAGMNVVGVGANVAIGSGAMQGGSGATGNTNVAIGNNSFNSATTGSRNVYIGNNVVANGVTNSTSGNDNIAIGNACVLTSATASNELNIGKALYGANIYTAVPRFGIGTMPLGGLAIDASSQVTALGLPKGITSAEPLGANVTAGATRYNTDMNLVTVYSSPSNVHVPISKIYYTQTTTNAVGITYGTQVQTVILDASVNAIVQAIPTVSTTYTNWKTDYNVINSNTNTVTFNFPANTYLNGIITTTYSASTGDRVTAECDGSKWIITVIKPHIYQSNNNYNGLNPVLDGEKIAYFDSSATGTITLPVAVDGRTITLVNDSVLALTLGTAVKTGNATTTTTLAIGERMTISYDATISQWRKIS